MTKQQKIEIARRFVSLHKNTNLAEWQLLSEVRVYGKDQLYVIYLNLIEGVLGDVQCTGDEYEIEISSHESKTGNSIIFTWED